MYTSRPLNGLEHCLCKTTMTNIRPLTITCNVKRTLMILDDVTSGEAFSYHTQFLITCGDVIFSIVTDSTVTSTLSTPKTWIKDKMLNHNWSTVCHAGPACIQIPISSGLLWYFFVFFCTCATHFQKCKMTNMCENRIRYTIIVQIRVIFSHLKLWFAIARHNFR